MIVHPLSKMSLRIDIVGPKLDSGTLHILTGTGFVVMRKSRVFLVTNRHNCTARNPDTNAFMVRGCLIEPDRFNVAFHKRDWIGEFITKEISLLNLDGSRAWHEHPRQSSETNYDIAAIEIEVSPDIELFPHDLYRTEPVQLPDGLDDPLMPENPLLSLAGDRVVIIGFPTGHERSSGWPLWKTGHIASEPTLDFDGHPTFLIDARTRPGQSGAPVCFAAAVGGYRSGDDGVHGHPDAYMLLGIYSSRIPEGEGIPESEFGRVWKVRAISELIEAIT